MSSTVTRSTAPNSAPTGAPKSAAAAARKRIQPGNIGSAADKAIVAEADGQAMGAMMTQRLLAQSIVTSCIALDLPADDHRWLTPCTMCKGTGASPRDGMPCPICDATGELDTRDILASIKRSASNYAPPTAHVTGDDLLKLARKAVTGVKVPASLSASDLASVVALRFMEDPKLCPGGKLPLWRRLDAALRPSCEVCNLRPATYRCEATDATESLLRCDRCSTATCGAATPLRSASHSARQRLSAWLGGVARNVSADEAKLTHRNVCADWTDPGDDAPTPEQIAATAATNAAQRVADKEAATDTDLLFALRDTAADALGRKLTSAESDACFITLSGLTRAEVAAQRNVQPNAVHVAAKRGRASLRKLDTTTVRYWTRGAGKVAAAADVAPTAHRIVFRPVPTGWDVAMPERVTVDPLAERLMAERYTCKHSAPQSWGERSAPCNGGATGHLPTWGEGAPCDSLSRRGSAGADAPTRHQPAAPHKALTYRLSGREWVALAEAMHRAADLCAAPLSTVDLSGAVYGPKDSHEGRNARHVPAPLSRRAPRAYWIKRERAFSAAWDKAWKEGATDAHKKSVAHAAANAVER